MFYKQHNTLEKFRIRAHLRSYIKDPIKIDEELLNTAAEKLKSIPYYNRDPAAEMAIELLYDAYMAGNCNELDLTDTGLKTIAYYQHGKLIKKPGVFAATN